MGESDNFETRKTQTKSVVTSFRADRQNWKRLKVLSAMQGVSVQEQLNVIIESYLDKNFDSLLGITASDSNNASQVTE
jgi:predicted DNA-binding ribbon-helix-helix protein